MKSIPNYSLDDNQAGLWFLGQSRYILRTKNVSIHYDVMVLNSENPQVLAYFAGQECPGVAVKILQLLE